MLGIGTMMPELFLKLNQLIAEKGLERLRVPCSLLLLITSES